MVPVELLSLEKKVGNDAEYGERYDFLYHLELHQSEGTAIAYVANAVGRNHEAVLQTGNEPRKEYHDKEWPIGGHTCFVEFQVTVPCKRHKDVAENQ